MDWTGDLSSGSSIICIFLVWRVPTRNITYPLSAEMLCDPPSYSSTLWSILRTNIAWLSFTHHFQAPQQPACNFLLWWTRICLQGYHWPRKSSDAGDQFSQLVDKSRVAAHAPASFLGTNTSVETEYTAVSSGNLIHVPNYWVIHWRK